MKQTQSIHIVRNLGLRATPARVAVMDIMEKTTKPLDVAEIINLLKKRKVDTDQATIYRIMDSFYDKGAITRLQFNDNKFRYEGKTSEHHHAICTHCGAIEDVSNCSIETLESQIEKTKGFKVENHSLEFFGLCKNCIV